jgi:hypothetical protein
MGGVSMLLAGDFKDGMADGRGVQIFPDGARYEGDFKARFEQPKRTIRVALILIS